MAVFGDPYAANVREFKARKKRIQKAEARLNRQKQRLFDERMRQARKDRLAQDEIRRKAKIRDEAVEVKRDLIQSIARGKGVGIFGAKMPRINKFIIHTGTGKPGKNVMGFEAQIDADQIKRLKSLAQTARDNQAARAQVPTR